VCEKDLPYTEVDLMIEACHGHSPFSAVFPPTILLLVRDTLLTPQPKTPDK